MSELLDFPTVIPLFIAFARGRGLSHTTIRVYVHAIRSYAFSPFAAPPPLTGNVKRLLTGNV